MIKVTGKVIEEAKDGGVTGRFRTYLKPTGLECKETKFLQFESDYQNGKFQRFSKDNGKTWTEWESLGDDGYSTMYGNDEMMDEYTREVWNPVHKHYVSTRLVRFCFGGHRAAYNAEYQGKNEYFDHQYTCIRNPFEDKPFSNELLKYEDGVDFDPQNPRNPEYLYKNRGYLNPPIVLKNGDIAVAVGITVRKACEMAGLDIEKVYPSTPDIHRAVMIARGKYNDDKKVYEYTFSNPVILSDMQSSRGIDEPMLAELESGRILLVMRASNTTYEDWHSRLEPKSPNFKWYSFSDDGAKTFCQPIIWHFDNREVIYSSASISEFIRSSKNGKLYWIGNITDHTAWDNFPRFPLCIVEVDETTGQPKKESYTVIDTRREGEPERVQLSNFMLLEDRETGNFELSLVKYGQFDFYNAFKGETWRYEINVDA